VGDSEATGFEPSAESGRGPHFRGVGVRRAGRRPRLGLDVTLVAGIATALTPSNARVQSSSDGCNRVAFSDSLAFFSRHSAASSPMLALPFGPPDDLERGLTPQLT
jgi:hypothetical protein